MNQLPLINTNLMSSHKELARIVRERRLSEYELTRTGSQRCVAQDAAAPDSTPNMQPLSSQETAKSESKPSLRSLRNASQQTELNMIDEDRDFDCRDLPRCPGCKAFTPAMQRRKGPDKHMLYRLVCYTRTERYNGLKANWSNKECQHYTTDWFPTSQQAIAVWKMTAKLTRV